MRPDLTPFGVTDAALRDFCERWSVAELSLFGSTARADFGPSSDVDLMVTFRPESAATLWDMVDMQEELEAIFGRRVDLVSRNAIRNPYRKRSIERDLTVLYAA
jgi:predicted nucleotidyltransferase